MLKVLVLSEPLHALRTYLRVADNVWALLWYAAPFRPVAEDVSWTRLPVPSDLRDNGMQMLRHGAGSTTDAECLDDCRPKTMTSADKSDGFASTVVTIRNANPGTCSVGGQVWSAITIDGQKMVRQMTPRTHYYGGERFHTVPRRACQPRGMASAHRVPGRLRRLQPHQAAASQSPTPIQQVLNTPSVLSVRLENRELNGNIALFVQYRLDRAEFPPPSVQEKPGR
ncbi:hypothetical protein BO94DRAFT_544404 [Aspergillus sclerotioniger CBS 115572]|uniref:DUF4232 domain-containing protein n=1 Tax=Aspergillus sclerotioniger CBS 115572 TaxID=1450535 RepID=A0A317WZ75_9EURO|nr:hypothetical protein BO94DRAFT_544404 [Aspergillus sclerotioniger CBS 115572]PWY91679.1 hypothetical protein BO94DRAFT_544404 [Aspergillus sclerotioniger CBS 115572]